MTQVGPPDCPIRAFPRGLDMGVRRGARRAYFDVAWPGEPVAAATLEDWRTAPLEDDAGVLGELLESLEGKSLFAHVEPARQAARARRAGDT